MLKEELMNFAEIINAAGYEIISFEEIDSYNKTPWEMPLSAYEKYFEFNLMLNENPKEGMIKLIEGFASIGYRIMVLDELSSYPKTALKCVPQVRR